MGFDIAIVVSLIILSGIFSGLTIGLMGLSKSEVIRAADLGNSDALDVLEVIKNSNKLLVTLLLGNTLVNVIISVLLNSLLGSGFIAVASATTVILIFGEILPASILTKHALRVGSLFSVPVKMLMFILTPLTFLVAKGLDKFIGVEGLTIFNRKELVHIVDQLNNSSDSDIDERDRKTLVGAILLSEKTVGEHMSKTPFTLDSETVINQALFEEVKSRGFTRIPVMLKNEVLGVLNVKNLIGMGGNSQQNVRNLIDEKNPMKVNTDDKLDDVMSKMIKNHSHIAMVKAYDTFVGVITLEDILEEILLTEILDEFDN